MYLPLLCAIVFSTFCFHFLSSLKYLFSFLMQFPVSRRLFSFHEFIYLLSLFTFSFNPCWTDKMEGVISVFHICSCPNMDILEKVSQVPEKKVYYLVFEWNGLQMSARFLLFMISFNPSIYLFSFSVVSWVIEVTHYHCVHFNIRCRCSSISFMKFGILEFSVRITISPWWDFPSMSM